MRKKILGVFVSLLFVAMLTMSLTVVFATKPDIFVSGTLTWAGTPILDVEEHPNGRHVTGTNFYEYTGSFEGDAVGDVVWTVHYKGGPTGTVGPLGTVSGRAFHTIDIDNTGSITLAISNANGKWRIVSGTGAFENIHGTGTLRPNPGVSFSHIYEGYVHFDP